MKRLISTCGIFLAMVAVGMLIAGAASTDLAACGTPYQCSPCDTTAQTVFHLSMLRCAPCEEPTPYRVYECYRGCSYPDPVDRICGCEVTGCWYGPLEL